VEDRTVIQSASTGSVRRGVRLNGIYEIEALLAHGGMGEVYTGFNIQTRDTVAIKMILPELSSNPEAMALFRREASTLHNLQHEAIVRYFVFSVDPDLNRAYLAMEFVDGPSLTKLLQNGPMPLAAVRVLQQRLASALDVAHRAGVIHRDISSDNVILPDNEATRAKIIDFGIARSKRPGERTIIGEGFAGKYNYVSPEQLGLAGGDVGPKSDIYSLGLVLAEALRGKPIDMSGSQVDIIEKRRKAPDLSDIDATMRPLIAAMLAPLPADRPESMAAVAAWSGGRATAGSVARPAPAPRSEKADRGSGRAVLVAGLVIVVLAAAGAGYYWRDLLLGATQSNVADSGSGLHKPPPLPAPVVDSKSPPLPAPPAQEGSPVAPPTQPDVAANGEAATKPHVPTADELVALLNKPGQPAPVAEPKPAAEAPGVKPAEALAKPEAKPPAPPAVNVDVKPPLVADANLPAKPPAKPLVNSPAPAPAAPKPPSPPAQTAAIVPPRAPQSTITVGGASVGKDYVADLPPFSDDAGAKSLALHTEPSLPEGLAFTDLGSGFGEISGRPAKPGQFVFDVVANNAAGAAARMTTRITVAPAPPEPASAPKPEQQNTASLTPTQKADAYLSGFDGGACFLARTRGVAGESIAIQGVGADKDAFQRFYAGFIHDVGVEPALTVRLIAKSQCPAVSLIAATGQANREGEPTIQLNAYDVSRGKPLAGSIGGLGGRHLDLLLVSNDGQVHKIDGRPNGDQGATFSVPISADANSLGALQIVVAIASPRPLNALATFRAGPAGDILPKVAAEMSDPAAALDVEFFKFVN
jgi:serine/threonine protein kinase